MDINNIETREKLAEYFAELGFKHIAEIGVERGVYTKTLCKCNPNAKIYGIDPFLAYKGYRDHVNQKKLDRFYQETINRLSPYNANIIKKFSIDAVKDFDDESLDAVYIDANHSFPNIAQDIWYWSRKVRKGGIVSGHDYKIFSGKFGLDGCHIKHVVDAWAKVKQIEIFFTKERTPSWFYIKE